MTTAAPTTAPPTTIAPTTIAPTTLAPDYWQTCFSEYSGDSFPDWTERWFAPDGVYTITPPAVSYGEAGMRIDGNGSRHALSWNDPGVVEDVEGLVRFNCNGEALSHKCRLYLRGGGPLWWQRGYFVTVNANTDDIELWKYDGPWPFATQLGSTYNTGEDLSHGGYFWIRFQVIGTALKVRFWADGDAEPGTWQITDTDTSHASGWVGLGTKNGSQNIFDWFSVATNGATANSPGDVADCTTPVPTTAVPTSAPPTTAPPTTLAPTTLAPTTLAPTTAAPTTVAPTTLAPTTTLTSTAPTTTLTTAAPTTAPPTTLAPTTLAPTTLAPTTLGPTTLAPTTAVPGTEIYLAPLEVVTSLAGYIHVLPPPDPAGGINQWGDVGPIEVTVSIHGRMQDVGILLSPINATATITFDSFDIGAVIDPGAIEVVTALTFTDITLGKDLDVEGCNWVKWSKIGELDFDIDESNLAGERPLDWRGCVYHIAMLGDKAMIYGANGITAMKPSGVHWGMDTISRIGLKNKGAFVGSKSQHFFVDLVGQLWQLDTQLKKLDYKEFISSMGTVILSLDIEQKLLYICDGTTGYIYGIEAESFGKGPANITGIGVQSNNLWVVSKSAIVTPKFEICTDIYDLGTRKPKTVETVELGTSVGNNNFFKVSIDYRTDYMDDFKQIDWFMVNRDGRAHPKCYGIEFRFRVKSTVYEYFELDYLKIRGHIHGFYVAG